MTSCVAAEIPSLPFSVSREIHQISGQHLCYQDAFDYKETVSSNWLKWEWKVLLRFPEEVCGQASVTWDLALSMSSGLPRWSNR